MNEHGLTVILDLGFLAKRRGNVVPPSTPQCGKRVPRSKLQAQPFARQPGGFPSSGWIPPAV